MPVGFGVFFSSNVVSFVHLPQCAQGFREFTCFPPWPKISGCRLGVIPLEGVTQYAHFDITSKPSASAVDRLYTPRADSTSLGLSRLWNEAISVDRWQNRELGPGKEASEKSYAERFNNRIVETVVANFEGNHEGLQRKYWRENLFCMWVSQSFYRWQHSWPKQSHFMTAWFGKIFRSIYRFASFRRFTSCKVWRFRIVHHCTSIPIRAFRIRTVLQDSADLPRLALLLVLQADGQPSAGKLTEMKREKGQKMDWAVKLALHSLVVSRCYLGSTYILRFVTPFIFNHFHILIPMLYCQEKARDLSKSWSII